MGKSRKKTGAANNGVQAAPKQPQPAENYQAEFPAWDAEAAERAERKLDAIAVPIDEAKDRAEDEAEYAEDRKAFALAAGIAGSVAALVEEAKEADLEAGYVAQAPQVEANPGYGGAAARAANPLGGVDQDEDQNRGPEGFEEERRGARHSLDVQDPAGGRNPRHSINNNGRRSSVRPPRHSINNNARRPSANQANNERQRLVAENPQQAFDKRKKRWMALAALGALTPATIWALTTLLDKKHSSGLDPYLKFLLNRILVVQDRNNNNALVGKSFYVTRNYFEWVCEQEGCIKDGKVDVTLLTERIMEYFGSDIYDLATLQIALVLLGRIDLAENQTVFLLNGKTADGNQNSTIRATSNPNLPPDSTFTYNGFYIIKDFLAYVFRMLAPTFILPDPLAGWNGIPKDSQSSWLDWKPITGEVAWALFIGPLHVLYAKYPKQGKPIPINEFALQHGVLTAVKKMQSAIGAIYYTTSDTAPNQGTGQVNPHTVSVENNISALSALRMYVDALQPLTGQTFPDGTTVSDELATLHEVITGIENFLLIYAYDPKRGYFVQGGLANDPNQPNEWMPTAEPFALDVQTWGLGVLCELMDELHGVGTCYNIWQMSKAKVGYFGPNGTPKDPIQGVGYSDQPAPVTTPTINITVTNAVGTQQTNNTMTVWALWQDGSTPLELTVVPIPFNASSEIVVPFNAPKTGVPLSAIQFLDEKTKYQIAVVAPSAVNNDALVNVQWNNPIVTITDYVPRHDVISAEWTFGAINMCRLAASYYLNIGRKDLAQSLSADDASMFAGVQQLRSDNFAKNPTNSTAPDSAKVPLPEDELAFVYANKRFSIPFGWKSGFYPSTCSTSMAVMIMNGYNFFVWGGEMKFLDWTPYFKDSPAIIARFGAERIQAIVEKYAKNPLPVAAKLLEEKRDFQFEDIVDVSSAQRTAEPLAIFALPKMLQQKSRSACKFLLDAASSWTDMLIKGMQMYALKTVLECPSYFPKDVVFRSPGNLPKQQYWNTTTSLLPQPATDSATCVAAPTFLLR